MGTRRSVFVRGAWFSVLFWVISCAWLNIPAAKGSGTIYIRADGSIDPPGTPISSTDNMTYTFTDDIFDSIVVERSNIVIEGDGYSVQDPGTVFGSIGIYLSGISNVTIRNVNVERFWYGIYLNLVNHCGLYGNNVTMNLCGIRIVGSSNNVMHHNSVTTNEYCGVTLYSSSNNTLRDNDIVGNGYNFAVYGESLSDFLQDVDTSNTVDGKPIHYWIDQHDAEIPSDAGYVALVNCSQIVLKNLTLTSNGQKILIAYTYDSLMLNVQASGSETSSYLFSDILIYHSSGNIVANSHFDCGLNLTLSSHNILRDNIIVGFVTMVKSSVGNLLQNNTIINALPHGIILLYSENNTVRNNTIYNSINDGIWLGLESQNNTIENNNITQNDRSGINEYSKGFNCIRNNVVTYNGWDGIAISSNNVVINNTITGNHVRGIISSSYNAISNNTIASNHESGVFAGSHNTIEGNVIANNTLGGLYVGGTANIIKHNDFLSNYVGQVILGSPSSSNVWDDGYPSGGNYWSDYKGLDWMSGIYQDQRGSDGIGDTPNTFTETNKDRYPLMKPMSSLQQPIAVFTHVPQEPAAYETIVFDASASRDRDGSITTYRWSFSDGNITTMATPIIKHVYAAATIYPVNLTITDNDGLSHSSIEYLTVTPNPDSTPPTTVHNYNDSWYTNDFTITLDATDGMSGVAETYYKINDGSTKNVNADGQPLITTEGASNKLEYWSIDKVGNEEDHNILTEIKLDKTAPAGSIIINDDDVYTTSTSATLTLTATDVTSGVYQVRFSNDGVWDTEQWETPSPTEAWTLAIGDGTRAVYYQTKDNAGLISTLSDSIILDTAKPAANAGDDQTVNEGMLVTLDASASTDENGIATYTWAFIDKTLQTLTGKNPTYTFSTSGTFTITLEVTDPAGNTATDTTTVTVRAAEVFPTWIIGGAIIATGITVTTALILRRRKKT